MQPRKQTCFTYDLNKEQQELLLGILVNGNYRRREVPYSVYAIEGDHLTAALYEREKHGLRKFCVQGSKAEDFVLFLLEPIVLGGVSLGYEKQLQPQLFTPHAGSDESGKGDYFGPLVVCCAYTDEALVDEMKKIGVRDCKKMTDKAVLETGAKLRKLLGPDRYAVVKLGPAAYNRLYAKMKNINRMLAWAHGAAIEDLLKKMPDCNRVVVDQFAPTETPILKALKARGKKATIEQRHKAESDIAVAAASVIAREQFLLAIAAMAKEVFPDPAQGQPMMPIGCSDPKVWDVAEKLIRENGPVWIMNHCKAHFQTTDKIFARCGFSREQLPPEGQILSSSMRKPVENPAPASEASAEPVED